MLLHYLRIALRNLARERVYSLINILGLAVGFACFSLIVAYVRNENSYDTFNKKAGQVYRVVCRMSAPGLGDYYNAVTPGPLGPALLAEVPQVKAFVRLRGAGSVFVSRDDRGFYEDNIRYADPAVFDLLGVRLKEGDPATALNRPLALVIDEETAAKYFPHEDPIGKQLRMATADTADLYTVTAVMHNYPENSHAGFSMLISYVTAEARQEFLRRWVTNSLATYVLLADNASQQEVEKHILEVVNKNLKPNASEHRTYSLQNLLDIHLRSSHILYQSNRNQGNAHLVHLFIVIGILVLLIASINYMNLATARSIKRAKEVGVRKVLGSGTRDLAARFLGESTATALLGFLLSLVIVEAVFPMFRSVMGTRFVADSHHSVLFILQLAGVSFVVGTLSGIYPAFILSSYPPALTARGILTKGRSGEALRKGLVLLQFGIAIFLFACTGVVRDQMEFVRTKDIGFDKSQLLYVPIRNAEARSRYAVMKNELARETSVLSVSGAGGMAGASGSDGTMVVSGTNSQTTLMMRFSPVDYDFFTTMGISVVQGREFSREMPSDSSSSVMINEAAVRELGWHNAIGKQFEEDSTGLLTVIGVIRDYHFFSLYTAIEPQIIYINRDRLSYLLAKLRPHNIDQGLAAMKRIWNEQLPSQPFEYGFVDEAFDQMYKADQKTQQLLTWFSAVAVCVGCLGLFGLSVFTAEQRTKEIGIRKVLGASVSSIAIALSMEFVRLVALSCVVAFPGAYWATQQWLQNFAYRTSVNPVTFVVAGSGVIIIALATVSFQSIKVARANPVESLRYE